MDPAKLERDTSKIIGDHPNTYTFSKAIGEYILMEEKGELPICIIRPSMISGSHTFPVRGWVDSFIGPAGLVVAYGLGAMHVMQGDKSCRPDIIPVDYVVNQMLVAAWHTAINPPGRRLPIYHACCGKNVPLTWHYVRSLSGGYYRRNPAKKSMGYPFLIMFRSGIVFWLSHHIFHVLPALIRDSQRVMIGKKTKMVKSTQVLHKIIMSLAYFTSNQWNFSLKNTTALFDTLNEIDSQTFNFNIQIIDWEEYLLHFVQGLKYYLLREAHDTVSVVNKL